MQAIVSVALTLPATPKGVIPKMVTERTSIYFKTPRLIKQCIAYLIVFSECGKANASISSVALPLSATPKTIKRGNKIGIYLCKRT